ncbi:MAG: cupin domain-containing protein [Candidatus Rokuibacteriota bacterium]|nr:MAG: cupin domain-containing protein [Candidatus Rokubacteria bacterium]
MSAGERRRSARGRPASLLSGKCHPWRKGTMFKQIVLCTALITFGMVLSLNAQPQPSPVQPSPIKRTILQRADVPGTNLEIIYATVEIAAGFKAGRHNHPGVVMGHVVEGDFWLHVDGQPEQVLHAGQSVTVPDRAIHNEGATDKPVKLNAVYVVEKGKPLAAPAQ